MENINIRHELNHYPNTSDYSSTQVVLPLDCGILIEQSDPVISFNQIMDEINLKVFVKRYTKGRHDYEEITLIKILLFAYMNQITSLRKIEEACRNDIRFIWLSQGIRPSHMTFYRLIKERLKGRFEDLFYEINEVLVRKDQIDTSVLYIDGTKFEANATKNSFVWKKAVLKNQKKLFEKISAFYRTYSLETKRSYHSDDLSEFKMALYNDCLLKKIEFVSGKGHHKPPLQKAYETIRDYQDKLKEYEEHLSICGERNSYSKTDHDATFMHMKEDYYMRTGIFKPGYNVQLGVSDEYIMMAKTYPNPTDTKTFIPFLEAHKKAYGFYPKTPVADAGYGSYDNYLYCVTRGMELYQKYSLYEQEKHGVKKKQKFQSKSMRQEDGSFVCPEGKSFNYVDSHLDEKGLYPKLIHHYQCVDCTDCPIAKDCKKSETNRHLSINPVLIELQSIAKENLDSARGIQLRMNRSAQSESTFGILKYNWGKQRFTRRGQENVDNELYLLCIGYNLMKYHSRKLRRNLS